MVAFSVVSPEIRQAIESIKYIAENMRSRNKAREVSIPNIYSRSDSAMFVTVQFPEENEKKILKCNTLNVGCIMKPIYVKTIKAVVSWETSVGMDCCEPAP